MHRAPVNRPASALTLATAQVQAVSDSPDGRLRLLLRTYAGPELGGHSRVRFRRAAVSFMRWQLRRGLLAPLDADPPGSDWWRAVNARLLRDGCEAVALAEGAAGDPSSSAVRFWSAFLSRPTARGWYRAHNASIVGGYLEQRSLAESESEPERFFMNIALARVLYAHAMVAAPKLALGRLAPIGPLLGDPRMGMAGAFLSLHRVLPDRFPLDEHVQTYIDSEHRIGRLLDYALILPRVRGVYGWSAAELEEPRLLSLLGTRGELVYGSPDTDSASWNLGRRGAVADVLDALAGAQGASGVPARDG